MSGSALRVVVMLFASGKADTQTGLRVCRPALHKDFQTRASRWSRWSR